MLTHTTVTTDYLRSLQDEDLMLMLQSGYEQAFEIIIERYQDKIHNFIYRYTRNHLDCEDLVQETFLRVYRCKHAYERIAKFSTWLYTIASNLTKSHYKKHSKMSTLSIFENEQEDDKMDIELCDREMHPDDQVNMKISLEYLAKALKELPDEFKEVVLLRDIQQLTYEEIEQITGLPMGTVKSRINRGRLRLKQMLTKYVNVETLFA